MLRIRRETDTDRDAADEVTAQAFAPSVGADGTVVEVTLLRALRADVGFVPALSLVAELDGDVVGHVICTEGEVDGTAVVGLGPISVVPPQQGRGVGQNLVHAAVAASDALGYPLVALLGSTDWYPRFGFVPATSVGVAPPNPDWGDFFQVRTLAAHDPSLTGEFAYAAPFRDLPG